jgi:hypothetical protein
LFFLSVCVCVCVCHLNHKRKVGNPLKFQRNSPRPIKNLPICFIFYAKLRLGNFLAQFNQNDKFLPWWNLNLEIQSLN